MWESKLPIGNKLKVVNKCMTPSISPANDWSKCTLLHVQRMLRQASAPQPHNGVWQNMNNLLWSQKSHWDIARHVVAIFNLVIRCVVFLILCSPTSILVKKDGQWSSDSLQVTIIKRVPLWFILIKTVADLQLARGDMTWLSFLPKGICHMQFANLSGRNPKVPRWVTLAGRWATLALRTSITKQKMHRTQWEAKTHRKVTEVHSGNKG